MKIRYLFKQLLWNEDTDKTERFPQIRSNNTLHPSFKQKVPEASQKTLEMLAKLSLRLCLDNSG